ncbi:similar to Saccharomyces cerevisiae YOR389W Putative protein of unknown function [Maudiozyma barnettii]|uniref:Uncharacterized protein n=1 Tax=Maudiozyma barnettii TaxID=61262 RepID=A0A8H2VFK5_9SACH|nr:hypothetical protein [Kazachstania barnettii]CAB4254278.1 similar to Saccharomyces cerevisiae YOR389W Putative protein of unknown function [Kazachstania barnettii]CAD1782067.1 similar to Saccharomyces cerevisiae YOR389W Putative protein of unknown function [Kazachstania barnettii]
MLSNNRSATVVILLTLITFITILSSAYISYKDVFVLGKLYDYSPSANQDETTNQKVTWETYTELLRPIDITNSTTLFNAVYAALRQASSDIHPIGLSYFPAMIPKGTLMYHAGGKDIPTGLEWLAMDHEFSYNFAMHGQRYGRNASNFNHHGPPGIGKKKDDASSEPPEPPKEFKWDRKHFLTFRATRDLNKMIYLDGASAAKSETGEMDTQKLLSDVIAYKMENGDGKNDNDDDQDNSDSGKKFVMAERLYAERICKWGMPFGLDGFIRVEVGFEVVLCDFLNGSTELVSNITIPNLNDVLGLPAPANVSKATGWPLDGEGKLIENELTEKQSEIMDQEDYWQSVLDEYSSMRGFDQIRAGIVHDSGDNRIQLDYRYLITGINRTLGDINPNNRRLLNDHFSFEQQLLLVNDLETSLHNDGFYPELSTNWQQVIDEIVDKFAPMIKMMDNILNPDQSEMTISQMALKTTRYTLNFVNRFTGNDNAVMISTRNSGEFGFGRQFAVYQYTRPLADLVTDSDYLIWSSAVNVVTEVVDTIYNIHDMLMPIVTADLGTKTSDYGEDKIDAQNAIKKSGELISSLISKLNWIALDYKCDRKCEWNEICYTPSWGPSPMSWAQPDDNSASFGMHYDETIGRKVINKELKCINAEFIMDYNNNRL